jgi:hypothetical protein
MPAAPTPKTSRLLSKHPEFVQILHPPTGADDILAHSNAYGQMKKEIEARLASITDPELRGRLSSEEWAKVDKQAFIPEGEEARELSLPQ